MARTRDQCCKRKEYFTCLIIFLRSCRYFWSVFHLIFKLSKRQMIHEQLCQSVTHPGKFAFLPAQKCCKDSFLAGYFANITELILNKSESLSQFIVFVQTFSFSHLTYYRLFLFGPLFFFKSTPRMSTCASDILNQLQEIQKNEKCKSLYRINQAIGDQESILTNGRML